jgi:outer membrane protein assembly factor BamB
MKCRAAVVLAALIAAIALSPAALDAAEQTPQARVRSFLAQCSQADGVCLVLGLPQGQSADMIVELAKQDKALIFFQSADADELRGVRDAAEQAGLLGKRVFAADGAWASVGLADNLVSQAWISASALAGRGVSREELLRVMHPQATAVLEGQGTLTKPVNLKTDDWSHPFHGPDNNPVSRDAVAVHPYNTQYLSGPLFGCISEMAVASGGRMFLAFGHTAFKRIENEVLNKLYGINAYNGRILWERKLREGFMIQRNTIVATPDVLYIGDDASCKLINARTGELMQELILPVDKSGGTCWKWMAIADGVLYALLGGEETQAERKEGTAPGFGHWPWQMWEGYDYSAGEKSYGFGRNLFAIDLSDKQIKWHYRSKDVIDSRGVCMNDESIFLYNPGKAVVAVQKKSGEPAWQMRDPDALKAIGKETRAQNYLNGFSPTPFVRCNKDILFFGGPQRPNLVALSARDGKMLWNRTDGNFHLVLHEKQLFAVGQQGKSSYILDYQTGKELKELLFRRGCTQATATTDSLFFRASGGTVRYDIKTGKRHHIAPMRPACQNGVITADGILHWTPWICGCALSLYGNIALAPASKAPVVKDAERLEVNAQAPAALRKLTGEVKKTGKGLLVGDMLFTVDDGGVIQAVANDGRVVWKQHASAGVNFFPEVWENRLYVGSNDGYVYCYEAATGTLLWRFLAAAQKRLIPVYDSIMSTWPVAGGVAVRDGVVYAAAGIAHYDGTHVYALDAKTGRVVWHNADTGSIGEVSNGISVHGQLRIVGDELVFGGGNAYPLARFRLADGECLNEPSDDARAGTTFYAIPPEFRSEMQQMQTVLQDAVNGYGVRILNESKPGVLTFDVGNASRQPLVYSFRWRNGVDGKDAKVRPSRLERTVAPGDAGTFTFNIPALSSELLPYAEWTVGSAAGEFKRGKVVLPTARRVKAVARGGVSTAAFAVNELTQLSAGRKEWTGPADCSARVTVRRTADAFEITVDVTDDVVTFAGVRRRQTDGVEIYLDTRPDAERKKNPTRYGKGAVQIICLPLAKNGAAISPGFWARSGAKPIPGLKATSFVRNNGYRIVVHIPKDALKADYYVPEGELRIDVGINDTDAGGRRKSQIIWSGNNDNWLDPSCFGRVLFE